MVNLYEESERFTEINMDGCAGYVHVMRRSILSYLPMVDLRQNGHHIPVNDSVGRQHMGRL